MHKNSVESQDPLSPSVTLNAIRVSIIKKHLAGKKNSKIRDELSDQNVNMRLVQRTIKRYREFGVINDRKRTGRPRSIRTPEVIKAVRERIRRNPARSGRKLGKDFKVGKTTMKIILKQDLGLKAYKKTKIHGLTDAQKVKRYERSKLLLDWHAGDEIIFSDEKLFLLQESHNAQNDRVYAATLDDIPSNKRNVQRFQNVSSVMVWGAISPRGKLPLIFIEKGVKINQKYYLDEVLKKVLLPEAQKLFGDDFYCFQQDGAPAHTAKLVQQWCEQNLTDFITKEEWPPSSPDLNPLDFCIWGYMLAHLNMKNIHTLEQFRKEIIKVWDEIPIEVVRAACADFEKRLKAVREIKGERFESN